LLRRYVNSTVLMTLEHITNVRTKGRRR